MKITQYLLFFICVTISTENTIGNANSLEHAEIDLNQSIKLAWELSNINPDSALAIANKALELANYYDLKDEKAELIRIKGLVYYYKVDFVQALNFFIQSRNLYIEIKNKVGEASALNNILIVYGRQGLLEKALELSHQVLEMRLEIGDSTRIAQSLNNLAVAYKDLNKPDEALKYYRQAVDLSYKINETQELDLYFNNIGVIYLEGNRYDSAFYYFNKALQFGEKNNNKQMITNSLTYLGDYYNRRKDYTQAIAVLEKSLSIAKEIGIVYEIESAAKQLHVAYSAVGRFEDAYKIHVLFKQMVDSANNLQTIQKITEIEALNKYEKEKLVQQLIHEKKEIENEFSLRKEKQIRNSALLVVFTTFILFYLLYRNYRKKSLLNLKLMTQRDEIISQKEEIESQRDEIEQLNKSKDKFFAIIAHDLKNPLSGIYRLSEIMKQNYEQINSEKLKVYIEQIFISTKKTYELLENLLKWAMVQNGSLQIAATEFNLTKVIRENIELLSENANQKKLNINFNQCDDCFVLADEEMITTVLRNLLNNAIKFSPENGNINFSISASAEFYKVSIKDQGIGISPVDQQLLFDLNNDARTIGTSKEKGTGLGLVLCKEFIELNGGKIWLKSELEKGSTFYFTVLMADKK